jgi:hypothetical protein
LESQRIGELCRYMDMDEKNIKVCHKEKLQEGVNWVILA